MRASVAVLVIFIAVPLVHSQQPSKPAHPATVEPAASAEDSQTRQDLQRMKALVQQMQTNLAFVTSIQGPLKHQFELEIEMWQFQIARMERRLGSVTQEK
jgi:uncharacterized membrane protein YgcG